MNRETWSWSVVFAQFPNFCLRTDTYWTDQRVCNLTGRGSRFLGINIFIVLQLLIQDIHTTLHLDPAGVEVSKLAKFYPLQMSFRSTLIRLISLSVCVCVCVGQSLVCRVYLVCDVLFSVSLQPHWNSRLKSVSQKQVAHREHIAGLYHSFLF